MASRASSPHRALSPHRKLSPPPSTPQKRPPFSPNRHNHQSPESPDRSSSKKPKSSESPTRTSESPTRTFGAPPKLKRKQTTTDLDTHQTIKNVMATEQIKNLLEAIKKIIKSKLQSLREIDKIDYVALVSKDVKSTRVYLGEDYNIDALGKNNGQNSMIFFINKGGKNIATIKALSGKVFDKIDKRIHPYYAAAATIVSIDNAENFNKIAQKVQNLEVIPIKMNRHEVFKQLDYITFAPFCKGASLAQLLPKKVDKDIERIDELTIIDTAAEPGSELDADFNLQRSLIILSGKKKPEKSEESEELDNLKIEIKDKIKAWFIDTSKPNENLLNEITNFLREKLDLEDKANILGLAVSLTFYVVKAKHNNLIVDATLSNFIVTTKDDDNKDFQAVIEKIQDAQTGSSSSSSSPLNASAASAASTMIASPSSSFDIGYETP